MIVAAAAPIPSDPSPLQSTEKKQWPVKGNLFDPGDHEEGEGEEEDDMVFDREENLSTADQNLNPGL